MTNLKVVSSLLAFLILLVTISFLVISLFSKDDLKLHLRYGLYFLISLAINMYYFVSVALYYHQNFKPEKYVDYSIDGLVIVFDIFFVWLLFKEYINKKSIVNNASIEECFRNLPSGICFFFEDGLVLASNKFINDIVQKLTGSTIVDGKLFWDYLLVNYTNENPDYPIVKIDDKVYMFILYKTEIEDADLYEVNCFDISEMYKISSELSEKNSELNKLNSRLRIYNENVDEIIKQEEILATKVHIHDQLGHLIMATRMALKDKRKSDKKLLKKWYDNIDLLTKAPESNYNSKGDNQLKQAGQAIGIKVNVSGKLPKDKQLYHLYLSAARELLINAKKHGGANNIFIDISQDSQYYIIKFKNDGQLPAGPIVPTGGLLSLKTRLENEGGKLEISYENDFEVIVYIARKGNEDV